MIEKVIGVIEGMAALEKHGCGELLSDLRRCLLHIRYAGDLPVPEHLRLGDVGREKIGQREEDPCQSFHRVIGQKPGPAGGHHDRVHDEFLRLIEAQPFGDGFDQRSGGDHPDLHRVWPQVGEDTVQLQREKIGGDLIDPLDAGRILGRQSRDRAHGKYAVHGHGLDIGLDPGASAGVASGDRQYFFHDDHSFVLILYSDREWCPRPAAVFYLFMLFRNASVFSNSFR